ncbi:MAG TPA: RHS repeat-associated core domain-containing protein, partial [Hanamia sp.]|nr:RHS repeat-associated core domain-containing protein [Hanamia sp.]
MFVSCPYGLKIAGISSVKLPDAAEGTIKNTYLYNDKEFFDDGGLNWYDYGFRNYDPQIGRFPQLDPLTWKYPQLTPYQYASDDPITNIDLDGLEGVSPLVDVGDAVVTAKSFLAPVVIKGLSKAQLAAK